MIASVVASPDSAFAKHRHHHGANTHGANTHDNGKSISQSISQGCSQNQHSSVVTAGAGSPVTGSGNNIAACKILTAAETQQPNKLNYKS